MTTDALRGLDLNGKVAALIGVGSDIDRAIAMVCAEAGAQLALATHSGEQAQEFAMNSIANEAWAVGAEQFVVTTDAAEPGALAAFASEVLRRYRRCDLVLVCEADHAPLLVGQAAAAFGESLAGALGRFVVVATALAELKAPLPAAVTAIAIHPSTPADAAAALTRALTN